jgi:hypothetical protein
MERVLGRVLDDEERAARAVPVHGHAVGAGERIGVQVSRNDVVVTGQRPESDLLGQP